MIRKLSHTLLINKLKRLDTLFYLLIVFFLFFYLTKIYPQRLSKIVKTLTHQLLKMILLLTV